MDLRLTLINFGTIASGILFVALPFVALGVFVSAMLQEFVGRERLLKLYGTGFWRNYLVSAGGGFLFPLCECGIVPVAKGLKRSGVPTSAVVMFLLSAPVLNPITVAATVAAFPTRPSVWLGRLLLSQALTVAIGWIFQSYVDEKGVPLPLLNEVDDASVCAHDGETKWQRVLASAFEELSRIFPYLLLGASLTSALQMVIPKNVLLSATASPLTAVLAMMLLALVLSVCSAVDAFVILPFAGTVPFAGLLAFLNFGPLIDVKNILLFRAYFAKKFQRWYFFLVTLCVLLASLLLWFVFPSPPLP